MKCFEHQEVEAVGTCTSCGKALCSDCSMDVGGKLACKPCTEKMATRCMAAPSAPKKEPALALLLSLIGGLVSGLLIGLGQAYNGQIKKGIILSIGHIVLGGAAVILYILSWFTLVGIIVCLPILFVPLALWLYAMYDAYVTADKINKGEPVKDWLD